MSFHILKEDGSGSILLEDGGNYFLLEGPESTIRVVAIAGGFYAGSFRAVGDVFDITGVSAFASWMAEAPGATLTSTTRATPSRIQPLPDLGPHDGVRPGDIYSPGRATTGFSFPPKDGHS